MKIKTISLNFSFFLIILTPLCLQSAAKRTDREDLGENQEICFELLKPKDPKNFGFIPVQPHNPIQQPTQPTHGTQRQQATSVPPLVTPPSEAQEAMLAHSPGSGSAFARVTPSGGRTASRLSSPASGYNGSPTPNTLRVIDLLSATLPTTSPDKKHCSGGNQ